MANGLMVLYPTHEKRVTLMRMLLNDGKSCSMKLSLTLFFYMNIINRRLYTFGGELFTNNNAITRAGFDCLFLSIYVILQ